MRNDLRIGCATVALALGALASGALAQTVIDDFETGTQHLAGVAGGFTSSTASVSAPAHAMAAFRKVGLQTLVAGGPVATADLDAWTAGDDQMRISFPIGGGSAYLTYEPASPVDLTAGGLHDRVVVDFSASTVGGTLVLMVFDSFGGHAAHSMPTSGGAHVFSFLQLMGADLTHITTLQVELHQTAWSQYDLRDIRAMRPAASWLRFDTPAATRAGPPYPLPPFEYLVTNAVPSDLQRAHLLNAFRTATGGVAGVAMTAMDSGGDMAAGRMGIVQAAWNEPGQPYASTGFDMRVDMSALSGVEPTPFLPALPSVVPTPTGFLLSYEVRFLGGGGEVDRTSMRQVLFDVEPGQGVQLSNARVYALSASPTARAAGEDAGFRVTFDALRTGAVDTARPLFSAMVTGDSQHAGTVAVPPTAIAIGLTRLEARPSVTRRSTRLQLARAAGAHAAIALYDVTGRLVRTLELAPGSRAGSWDGHEASGRSAPAGLYLARFADDEGSARTRIVLVR